MWVCLDKERKQRQKYLHNNQRMQNLFAPKMALDVDSIMSGEKKNMAMFIWIIEEVTQVGPISLIL